MAILQILSAKKQIKKLYSVISQLCGSPPTHTRYLGIYFITFIEHQILLDG